MDAATKLKKQREFLTSCTNKIDYTLEHGVRNLKYLGLPTTEHEKILREARQVLGAEKIPGKKELKGAVDGMDDEIYYMIHCFVEGLLAIEKITVNEQYAEKVSRAQLDYQAKITKSLDNKQSHSPGFDGQGGGAARGNRQVVNQ